MPLAEEYSVLSRAALVVLAVLASLGMAGTIFGFQSLRPALIQSDVYSHLCRSDEEKPCPAQLLRLNLIFTVASTGANVASLPIGACLDRFGPRATVLVGTSLFSLGTLLFGLSGPAFDAYLVGYLLLGVGGPFAFIGCLHISTVFPANAGLVMAAMTGAFDASSSIYFVFASIVESTGIDVHALFLVYAAVPVLIAVTATVLMPRDSFGTKPAISLPIPEADGLEPDEAQPLLPPHEDGILVAQRTRALLWKQLKSPEFWGITATICVFMLRLNFYISSVREQLLDLGDHPKEDTVKPLLSFFNVALPAAGIVSIPAVGYLLDNFSFSTSFAVLWAFGASFGTLGLVRNIPIQYVTIAIFVVMRPLLYTIGNDFCAKEFGFATFGRLYGIMNFIAGITNLLQYPLFYIALDKMGAFWLTNSVLLGLTALGVAWFPIYLRRRQTHLELPEPHLEQRADDGDPHEDH